MAAADDTYDAVALAVLLFEWPLDLETSHRKIKGRLRYRKLGPYDQARVDTLRAFSKDMIHEIGKASDSSCYRGQTQRYSDMADWDIEALETLLAGRHPEVPRAAMHRILPLAILQYHLR